MVICPEASSVPPSQWRSLRTTNAIERLHEEFKRRIKTQTVLWPCRKGLIERCGLASNCWLRCSSSEVQRSPALVKANGGRSDVCANIQSDASRNGQLTESVVYLWIEVTKPIEAAAHRIVALRVAMVEQAILANEVPGIVGGTGSRSRIEARGVLNG